MFKNRRKPGSIIVPATVKIGRKMSLKSKRSRCRALEVARASRRTFKTN